eukprot:COSAG02_NODE_43799_length_371_cov_1.213235_1_plen_21_part_10
MIPSDAAPETMEACAVDGACN